MSGVNFPTPHLRFVTRAVSDGVDAHGYVHWIPHKALQQAVETTDDAGECVFVWRDVPLVTDPESNMTAKLGIDLRADDGDEA